jgi:hypothetical protein
MRACHAGCPPRERTGPQAVPRASAPARQRRPRPAGDVAFPVVTSVRRDAARITRWHGAGDVLRPLSRSLAPGLGVTRCPEHRHDQHPEAYESDNHRQDDPRRGAKKLLLRCLDGWRWGHVAHLLRTSPLPRGQHPCLKLLQNLADHRHRLYFAGANPLDRCDGAHRANQERCTQLGLFMHSHGAIQASALQRRDHLVPGQHDKSCPSSRWGG